jgi:hypothetical protein
VPRSTNRDLGECCVFRQIEVRGLEVESDCFLDVGAGFGFGVPSGGAAGEFGTNGRPSFDDGVEFEHDAEFHDLIVRLLLPGLRRIHPMTRTRSFASTDASGVISMCSTNL